LVLHKNHKKSINVHKLILAKEIVLNKVSNISLIVFISRF